MISINRFGKSVMIIAVATVMATVVCVSVGVHTKAKQRGDFVMNSDETAITAYEGTGGTVTIPDGITTIGAGAFMNSSVTTVDLNEVKTIGNNAFSGSTLSSVTGTGGVVAIGGEAFANTHLKAFSVPKSLRRLAGDAFNGDTEMTGFSGGSNDYPIYGGCVYSDQGKTLLIVPRGMSDSLTVSKKAVAIADGALTGCDGIKDVYIPSTVKTFGGMTDTATKGITLPQNATIYGYSGSKAEAYASAHGTKFVSVGKADGRAALAEVAEAEGELLEPAAVPEEVNNEPVETASVSGGNDVETASIERSGSTAVYSSEDSASERVSGTYQDLINEESGADDEYWVEASDDDYYYEEDELSGYARDYAYISKSEIYEGETAPIKSESSPLFAEDPIQTASKSYSRAVARETVTKAETVTDTLPVEGESSSSSNTSETTAPQTNTQTADTTQQTPNTTSTIESAVTPEPASTPSVPVSEPSHVRDVTPKTADISIRPSFVLCAAIFLIGIAGIIFARRKSMLQLALAANNDYRDELD